MNSDQIQNMIDKSIEKAIDRHNKTASLISALIGTFLLGFYTHGVITIVNNLKNLIKFKWKIQNKTSIQK